MVARAVPRAFHAPGYRSNGKPGTQVTSAQLALSLAVARKCPRPIRSRAQTLEQPQRNYELCFFIFILCPASSSSLLSEPSPFVSIFVNIASALAACSAAESRPSAF